MKPHDRGPVKTQQIDLGQDYDLMAYFSLENDTWVKTNYKFDWQLSFACADTLNEVYLNPAVLMKAALLPQSDFAFVPATDNADMRAEHPQFLSDSLALKGIVNSNQLALIDLGVDDAGQSLGFMKIKVSLSDSTYTLAYGAVDAAEPRIVTITKNNLYNTTEVNLQLGDAVQVSPAKNSFDLYFGEYTFQFYKPYMPYLVNGVLLNPHNTKVARISNVAFADISLETIKTAEFSNQRDGIGYDWKFYDFNTSSYTVHSEVSYVVQTAKGLYYKLRFLDFYNENGEKGSPKFEYQLL
ncbi:hypothetical protein GC194_06725 [bacterium]|nr:hypothetical protein [bacterium]